MYVIKWLKGIENRLYVMRTANEIINLYGSLFYSDSVVPRKCQAIKIRGKMKMKTNPTYQNKLFDCYHSILISADDLYRIVNSKHLTVLCFSSA